MGRHGDRRQPSSRDFYIDNGSTREQGGSALVAIGVTMLKDWAIVLPPVTALTATRAADRRCQPMGQRPIRSQHVFSHHCVTGPVVGEPAREPHLASSSCRLSSTEQSTA
jgi:hypothetical protein